MREGEFRKYLQLQHLSANGITARLSRCKRVEKDFGIDLEDVAKSETKMQELRRGVYDNQKYTWRQRRNFPNGLRKYFKFVNGYELPRLNRNSL